VIVPGATHLFGAPGALDEVARLARKWFKRHLVPAEAYRPGPAQRRRPAPRVLAATMLERSEEPWRYN
jgi:hypothetical protein